MAPASSPPDRIATGPASLAEPPEMERVWRALGDPTRRSLLGALASGPRTTGWLADRCAPLTRYAVMKHLKVLEEAGLVAVRRRGRERWNHLNAGPIRDACTPFLRQIEAGWNTKLGRLKAIAESDATQDTAHTPGADAPTQEAHAMAIEQLKPGQVRAAVVTTSVEIDAGVETVYAAFINRPSEWFYENEEAQTTRPTTFEPKVGGAMYLALPGNGFNIIGTCTMIKPNHKVRLRGDCTQPNAFVANMTIAFEKTSTGCRVSVEHRMMGEYPDDLPAGFEEGWLDGLTKLKALVEGAGVPAGG